MKPQEFFAQLDDAAVLTAIGDAEQLSSGEIRVYVANEATDDALGRAAYHFGRLRMHETKDRNGVLIYFAPKVQKFAVVGDYGIHERCGQGFWEELVAEIGAGLREKKFTPAVVGAVLKVGDLLAKHFPRADDDHNELPNEIVRD
jgi:uncharacterized membrane protein